MSDVFVFSASPKAIPPVSLILFSVCLVRKENNVSLTEIFRVHVFTTQIKFSECCVCSQPFTQCDCPFVFQTASYSITSNNGTTFASTSVCEQEVMMKNTTQV